MLVGGHAWCEDFVVERHPPRRFLHRAERVGGLQREAVDIGAIEAGNVHVRRDIFREHTVQRLMERQGLRAERRETKVLAEPRRRLVARDDVEKLGLASDAHSRPPHVGGVGASVAGGLNRSGRAIRASAARRSIIRTGRR